MMNPLLSSWRAGKLLVGLLLVLVALAGGCSSSRGGSVQLDSTENGQSVLYAFNQAYMTQGRAGEYDIVLVDSAAEWNYRKGKRSKPLQPTQLAPIRHVMHIHLHWRPLAGTTRNPAAINSSVDWYVLGPDGSDAMMLYDGAGYISVRGSGSERTVIIKDGQIKPKFHRGELGDPIGSAHIGGEVTAVVSDLRVKEILAEMERETGLAKRNAGGRLNDPSPNDEARMSEE